MKDTNGRYSTRLAKAGLGTASQYRERITASTEAEGRVLTFLDSIGEPHSGQVSQGTLAKVAAVDARTWRRWEADAPTMPAAVGRLLYQIALEKKDPKS